MKLVALLMFCAVAAAAYSLEAGEVHKVQVASIETPLNFGASIGLAGDSRDGRSILVNIFVNQVIAYIRRIINSGSAIFGIPPLDPLDLEHFHVDLPAGLINLNLDLHNVHVTGFGGFVMHTSNLNIRDLTFDLDLSFPSINAKAGLYDMVGDLFTAIPLFGKGEAEFIIEGLRIKALLHLKQSEDGKAVLLDRVENASFDLPTFKAHMTGVIGGGDIDKIVNALVEEVLIDYVRRFHGAISAAASHMIVVTMNPILEQFDTWRYLAPFM